MFRRNLTRAANRHLVAHMQSQTRISAIEKRASGLNLSLAGVCRKAGVDYSLIYRWRCGEVSPTERNLEKRLAKLEHWLEAEEAAMLDRLIEIVPPPTQPKSRLKNRSAA